jgi:hypothetical protein
MIDPRMRVKTTPCPRNRYFARAYPQAVARADAPAALTMAYRKVLSSQVLNTPPWKVKTDPMFSNSRNALPNQSPKVVKRSVLLLVEEMKSHTSGTRK